MRSLVLVSMRTFLVAATLTLVLASAPALAGSDLDVFIAGQAVQPNVMILFDNSGSMSAAPPYDPTLTYTGTYNPTTIYDRCKTFNSGSCTCKTTQTSWQVHTSACGFVDAPPADGNDDRAPSYVKTGNRRNFDIDPANAIPKLDVAKSVIDNVLLDDANANVRFGLMVLNNNSIPTDYTKQSQMTTYFNDKSILKAALGTDHSTLKGIVDGLTAIAGTPLANRAIAVAHYYKNDGYFSGADPVQYVCQRNFMVIMTDGRPQAEGDTALGGSSPNPLGGANAAGEFDYIESWLGTPYDKDGDGRDPDPLHFNPPAGCTSSSPDAEPCEYQNGGSDYLDDVCKVLAETDLRPDLDGQQSLVTYTIGFTVANGLLQRAASHGGGKYFTANNSDELADAFRQTLNSIQAETESFVAPVVPVSQTTRTQSGDRLYIALFRPRDATVRWPGNLKKYRVTDAGALLDANGSAATDAAGNILATSQSYWDTTPSGRNVTKGGVGELLRNRTAARNIYTNLSGGDLSASGNAFTVANSALTAGMLGVANATDRSDLIQYIHGIDTYDDDEDGNVTEKRDWIMGDIIHSVPFVVHYGATDAAILVGSNDGMLHAFDDATGDELWAFIPSDLLGRLKELPPGGSGSHSFFVDSSPKVLTTSSGQKIAVFGLGRGGRAYYAIDVTQKTQPTFLWKVTNASGGFSELGQSWSEPAFTKIASGGSGVDAVMVGAGYDPYFDDPSHTTTNTSGYGRGVFVINATSGALIANIRPAGMDWAIPSTVAALDLTGDGILDRAYVGDLGGQMWRINGALQATLLFSAAANHKIFYAPDVVRDRGFLSVFFGTGDRNNPLQTTVEDRLYGIKDDGASNKTESSLVDVTTQVVQNGSDAETTLKNSLKTSSGWMIRLNQRPGEKVLASPTAFFSVFFSTFTPVSGVCNAGGDARLYALNYETGGIPDSAVEDPDGDGPAQPPSVSRDMRFIAIGQSIPTELTVTIQKETSTGFIASSGAVDQPPLPKLPNNVSPVSWRECSTSAPCP
jgi:type IV pilus assembly protein PilY1